MNELFPNAKKIEIQKSEMYPYEMGDEEFHPIDEKNHYCEILQKMFGEQRGYKMAVVDIEIINDKVILSVIE